jgi:hypothetical protein
MTEESLFPCPAQAGNDTSSQKRPRLLQFNLQLKAAAARTQESGMLKDVSGPKTNVYFGATTTRSPELTMQIG